MNWTWKDFWLMFLINFTIAVMVVLSIGVLWGSEIEGKINSKADTSDLKKVSTQNWIIIQNQDTMKNQQDAIIKLLKNDK